MNNINKFDIAERPEYSADTKLFFDDVYKSGTRGKKQQVDVLQYGRSMIEMLGVLAIVGVLSVGGIAGYSKAMEKFKINKTIDQVSHIVANVRTLYAQQTTYSGLNEQSAIKMGIIPDSLTTSNSYPYITNAFGGRVVIYDVNSSWSLIDAPFKTFMIAFGSLPKEACVTLATMDWGSISSSGFVAISVGSNWQTGPAHSYFGNCSGDSDNVMAIACSGDANNPSPMNVAKASSACSACSEYGFCNIGLKFQ